LKEGRPHLVQFELSSHRFSKFDFGLNPKLDQGFSSGPRPNFELNLGSVQLGSGLNFSSELNFSNPSMSEVNLLLHKYQGPRSQVVSALRLAQQRDIVSQPPENMHSTATAEPFSCNDNVKIVSRYIEMS